VIKVFPTGHVGVFLVGGMIVRFLTLFIGAVTHSQNMTSDRVREKKYQEHGRMLIITSRVLQTHLPSGVVRERSFGE